MPAPLRRVLRFLRLALVCLALVWSSAPAAAAPITDTIALVAVARDAAAADHRAPADLQDAERTPPDRVAPAPEPEREPEIQPPRRLYLEHRALLC